MLSWTLPLDDCVLVLAFFFSKRAGDGGCWGGEDFSSRTVETDRKKHAFFRPLNLHLRFSVLCDSLACATLATKPSLAVQRGAKDAESADSL